MMLHRLTTLAFGGVFLLGFSGCATVMEGPTDPITISSTPVDGAECRLKNDAGYWSAFTPQTVDVGKSRSNLEITCTAPGYAPAHVSLESSFAPWTIGNVLNGVVIGMGVDAASGAMNTYPDSVLVTFQRPGMRATYAPTPVAGPTASAPAGTYAPGTYAPGTLPPPSASAPPEQPASAPPSPPKASTPWDNFPPPR